VTVDIPVAVSGAITIALIVVLGVFVFPALRRRAMGRWIVAVATLALMALFFLFDSASGLSSQPLVSAIAIGLAPLLAGTIVYRLQRGKTS
jgi:archaellum biogenesis protein FlaJ (TadC family)